jgi:hypothetical protein
MPCTTSSGCPIGLPAGLGAFDTRPSLARLRDLHEPLTAVDGSTTLIEELLRARLLVAVDQVD